jgi:hypothetical protein
MVTRSIALALACSLIAAADEGMWARAPAEPPQRVPLDGVLSAYLDGDIGIVARTFTRSRDFEARLRISEPRELQRWLGSWDRGKAVLLLEMASTAGRGVAPQYTVVLVRIGREYLTTAGGGESAPSASPAFARLWHRAAVGLLQGFSQPSNTEEHLDALGERSRGTPSVPLDARLVLARAVAQERRCWDRRPAIDQAGDGVTALARAAGLIVENDLDGPTKAGQKAAVAAHRACLREALARFEAAAAMDEARAEARVRGGWILYQEGRHADALKWLDGVVAGDDRDLAYWLALFRGRALSALNRPQDAAAAYRAAVALYPTAQAAGIGLALELMRLDRMQEAHEAARVVRTAGASATDPWSSYGAGDRRFFDLWIDQLRTAIR